MPELNSVAAVIAALCLVAVLLVLSVFMLVTSWKIATKAGYPGWTMLVPYYATFILLRIIKRPASWGWIVIVLSTVQTILSIYESIMGTKSADQPLWYTTVSVIIPLIAAVYHVRMTHGFSRVFGKTKLFTLGLIFLPVIFFPILAFGNAQYQPDGMVYNSYGAA